MVVVTPLETVQAVVADAAPWTPPHVEKLNGSIKDLIVNHAKTHKLLVTLLHSVLQQASERGLTLQHEVVPGGYARTDLERWRYEREAAQHRCALCETPFKPGQRLAVLDNPGGSPLKWHSLEDHDWSAVGKTE